MFITTKMQNDKQRQSSLEAERFYSNSYAFSNELMTKYQNTRTSKNHFTNSYQTNNFVMRNI